MGLVDTRTWETYAAGAAVVVDSTKNITAVTGNPTVETAAAQHGTKGLRCHSGAVGGEAVGFGAGPIGGRQFYGTIVTAGAGTCVIGAVKNGATYSARIRLNPTGTHFDLTNFDGSVVEDTTANTYAVGTPFRIDVVWNYAAGNIEVEARIFTGSNVEGFKPDDTLGPITFASAVVPNRFQIGTVNTAWAVDFDTISEYADDTVWPVPYVSTAALSMRPVLEISNTNWTNVGGATDRTAALADASDSTLMQSAAAGTSSNKQWLGPGVTPDTAALHVKCALTTAWSGTFQAKVYEGTNPGVLKETLTVPVTTTLTDQVVAINPALYSDWTNIYVELVAVP